MQLGEVRVGAVLEPPVQPPLSLVTNSSTPAERVGPGRTQFTVTPVPAHDSARPREMASWAVLVMP